MASSGNAAGEDVEDDLLGTVDCWRASGGVTLEGEEEVAGKVQAMGGPADGAGAVEPEDAEGDGEAAAAGDDVDEAGVGRVVVVFGVALVSVAGDEGGQCPGARCNVVRG